MAKKLHEIMDPISLLSKVQVVGGDVMELGILLACIANLGTNKNIFPSQKRDRNTPNYVIV